jgi:large conductance mechanosensitive channel
MMRKARNLRLGITTEGIMSLIAEFKQFAMKGNVLDMAVGVVIGAAFGKIVAAFVDAIIMPALGWAIGGADFSSLAMTLGTNAATGEPVTIAYGKFIQALVDFLIIAAAIFMALKAINRLKAPAPAAAPPPPPADVVLLTEIRDLLRQR